MNQVDQPCVQVLDHGYIKLIESWGSDQGIVETARQSTQKGFLGWGPKRECVVCGGPCGAVTPECSPGRLCRPIEKPGDERLLRFLKEHHHCYDEQTEVLTLRGFVRWRDVREGESLGQWDAAQDSLVYEAPRELIRQYYNGPMYRVDHGGVDLLVTPDHKMFVKQIVAAPPGETRRQCWDDQWRLVEARILDSRSMVRYRKHAAFRALADFVDADAIFPQCNDARALLRLVGFFIGDGHSTGTGNAVGFHLRKKRKITFLREVCLEIGWELRELSNDHYSVRAEGLGALFRMQFYEGQEKRMPAWLLALNAQDAAAVLQGLRASNGSEHRGAWTYTSTSRDVIEGLQRLALHAGEVCHFALGECLHRATVLSRMTEPVINQGKINTTWEDYAGDVYCAHTRTGVLVVRRNGKIVLSGNSTPFEFAGATFEVQAPIAVFREWHRHRTQSYSEASARYAPLPDLNYVPDTFRLMQVNQGGSNKQAGAVKGADCLSEQDCEEFRIELAEMYRIQQGFYEKWLARGVAKELARIDLPVGRYSRMRATTDLRNWLGFLTLRMDPAAQWEIRQYAIQIHTMLTWCFPRTMDLFNQGGVR